MKGFKIAVLTALLVYSTAYFSQDKFKRAHHLLRTGTAGIQPADFAARTSVISKPGKSRNYYWDSGANLWQYADTSWYTYTGTGDLSSETRRDSGPLSRELNTYDAQGRLVESRFQVWNSGSSAWENNNRTVYVYNAQGYQSEFRYESYNTSTSQWDIQFGQKNLLTYNASNRITDNIYLSWNSTSQIWENMYRETAIQYDGNGNLTQYDGQMPNGNLWDNDSRFKLIYALNNQPTEATLQTWTGSAFVNSERYQNLSFHNWCGYYCNDNALSTVTLQTWASVNPNQWGTDARINVTYDAFGGSIEIDQDYNGSGWDNNSRYTNAFDSHSNNKGYTAEGWNTSTFVYDTVDASKIIYTYDANFNITQTIWQYWDTGGNTLVNSEKRDYFNFTSIVGLSESGQSGSEMQFFPNPCKSSCTLIVPGYAGSSDENSLLNIYNLSGMLLYSSEIKSGSVQVEAGDLEPGLYFFTVQQGQSLMGRGKFIKE
ncbi:MAG TPA: T9SS type A sorting domain-containing protein [Bacteroidia bacterium]|nr:T9SS type A sorting domain-containing protein [Bacteroidia bacterium]